MEEVLTYRPLPHCVTVKDSEIEGLGLFATEDIEEGYVFGVTHIADVRFENGYIRTPLGGFINHNDNANCKLDRGDTPFPVYQNGKVFVLVATRDIKKNEEITTKYSLYKLKD